MLEAGAARAGLPVNVGRVLLALEGAASAFTRRRAEEPTSTPAWRRRLRRLVSALRGLEDELHCLARDEAGLQRTRRASLRLWGSTEGLKAWRWHLEGLRAQAEAMLLREAARSAPPGQRPDRATRRLVLDVARILHREGFPLSTYTEGLLAQVVTVVAARAGHALPEDERGRRRLLRAAVRFHRGGGIAVVREGNRTLTPAPSGRLPCLAAEEGRWES